MTSKLFWKIQYFSFKCFTGTFTVLSTTECNEILPQRQRSYSLNNDECGVIWYCSDGENRCSEVSSWKLAWPRFCILLMLFTSEVVTLTLLLASDFELRRTFLSCRVSERKDTFGDGNEFQFSVELHFIGHLMRHKIRWYARKNSNGLSDTEVTTLSAILCTYVTWKKYFLYFILLELVYNK